MKHFLFIVALLGWTEVASAQISTVEPARFKTKVSCYAGGTNATLVSVGINLAPESTFPNQPQNNCLILASPQASELTWKFIWREKGHDVYRFTFRRLAAPGVTEAVTTTRDVKFNGKKEVVFKDLSHTVVLELPNDEDQQAAQRT